MAATTWSMVVGSSSSTFALYHALTPPCIPVRMGSGKGSTKACFTVGCSGTMRTFDRCTTSPIVIPPCRGFLDHRPHLCNEDIGGAGACQATLSHQLFQHLRRVSGLSGVDA